MEQETHRETAPETQPEQPSQGGEMDSKGVAALAYVLFFLPYLLAPKSSFAKYHANQALLLLITCIVVQVLGMAIPVLGWFIIYPLGMIFVIVLFIMGIINALNGVKKQLPLIGRWTLLK